MVPEIISVATAITMTASPILDVWFTYVICHMTNVVSFSDTSKKDIDDDKHYRICYH